jgi:type IV pilus assembly protein PilW
MNRTRNQGGFSLVELMIGVALGLIVMAALTSFFVKSSQNRREIDRAGRQIENGRYAVSALRDELHLTGFFAELSTAGVSWQTPDPCTATGAMGFQVTPLQIPVPIFGYADGATMPTAVGDAAGVPRLLEALADAGWDEPALTAFAHGNWLRVLRATLRGV